MEHSFHNEIGDNKEFMLKQTHRGNLFVRKTTRSANWLAHLIMLPQGCRILSCDRGQLYRRFSCLEHFNEVRRKRTYGRKFSIQPYNLLGSQGPCPPAFMAKRGSQAFMCNLGNHASAMGANQFTSLVQSPTHLPMSRLCILHHSPLHIERHKGRSG